MLTISSLWRFAMLPPAEFSTDARAENITVNYRYGQQFVERRAKISGLNTTINKPLTG